MAVVKSARYILAVFVLALMALSMISCAGISRAANPKHDVAYVGPALLTLRLDSAKSADAAVTLKHGDHLEILDFRRRSVRAHSADGSTGWVDANVLLTEEEMQERRRVVELARKLPSQGSASASGPINLHLEPDRASPTHAQSAEGSHVQVLEHRLVPRVTRISALAQALHMRPVKEKLQTKKKGTPLLVLRPRVPGLPANWQEMSYPRANALSDSADSAAKPSTANAEDWNLVRTASGDTGWVLSRMLYMEIPDELARLAEGQRVTAYLALDKAPHPSFVWASAKRGNLSGDFNTLRVSRWSEKKEHYENAYVERNLEGFYPLELVASTGIVCEFTTKIREPQHVPGPIELKPKKRPMKAETNDRVQGTLYKRVYMFDFFAKRRVRLISAEALNDAVSNQTQATVPPPRKLILGLF